MVQEHLIELSVGESFRIGQYQVTLLEVDGEELCIEICGDDRGGAALEPLECDALLATI